MAYAIQEALSDEDNTLRLYSNDIAESRPKSCSITEGLSAVRRWAENQDELGKRLVKLIVIAGIVWGAGTIGLPPLPGLPDTVLNALKIFEDPCWLYGLYDELRNVLEDKKTELRLVLDKISEKNYNKIFETVLETVLKKISEKNSKKTLIEPLKGALKPVLVPLGY